PGIPSVRRTIMWTKLLSVLVLAGGVAVAGLTSAPKSGGCEAGGRCVALTAPLSCCTPDADCCNPPQACCGGAASCCPDGACCPDGPCCGKTAAAKAGCCPGGACCPDGPCCGGK